MDAGAHMGGHRRVEVQSRGRQDQPRTVRLHRHAGVSRAPSARPSPEAFHEVAARRADDAIRLRDVRPGKVAEGAASSAHREEHARLVVVADARRVADDRDGPE